MTDVHRPVPGRHDVMSGAAPSQQCRNNTATPRFFVTRTGRAGGPPRYFWQPSTNLHKRGYRAQRVPLDWHTFTDPAALVLAAVRRCHELNAELDRDRERNTSEASSYTRRSTAATRRGDAASGGRPYIYVIGTPCGLQKIGVSRAPEERRRSLSTAHGFELQIWFLAGGRSAFAERIEGLAHAALSDCRRSGEWFACTPTRAISVVCAAFAKFHDGSA